MRILLTTVAVVGLAAGAQARPLEPVDGSITYNNPGIRIGFTRSPAGSTFEHHFRDNGGDHIVETYRIRADGTLEIVDRVHRQHG
jgi:hypothetical protein